MPLALYMAVGLYCSKLLQRYYITIKLFYLIKPLWGVVQTLRTDVMNAALDSLSAFDKQPVGQLISRVTNDTEVIKDLFVMVVPTVFRSLALICAMLVAMFSLEWRMASIAVMIFLQYLW